MIVSYCLNSLFPRAALLLIRSTTTDGGFCSITSSFYTLVHCYNRIDCHVINMPFFPPVKTISTLQRWSSRPRVWSSQRSSFSLSQQCYYSTQEAEKMPEEEPLHNIINDTESVQGGAKKKSKAVVLLQYLISTISMPFLSSIMQVASPNMNFRLRQKSYWILLLGHCIQRKR